MTDKDRIDRMIHDHELDKKYVTAADVLMFLENQYNYLESRISENSDCYLLLDRVFLMLKHEFCNEASSMAIKGITYEPSEIYKLIRENRETIVSNICMCYAKDSLRSKKRTADLVIATLNEVIRYLRMNYEIRLRGFAISQVNHYDVDALYPAGTDNGAVKVTTKDVTIDTPTATITITQKETNK